MNKLTLTIVSALILGGTIFASTAQAYRGDPSVQGPNYSAERHEAMTQAFANKDFNSWKELMSGKGRVTEVVNEANFARFAEMHQLRLDGKTVEANQIRAELGLGQGMGYGRNNHR